MIGFRGFAARSPFDESFFAVAESVQPVWASFAVVHRDRDVSVVAKLWVWPLIAAAVKARCSAWWVNGTPSKG